MTFDDWMRHKGFSESSVLKYSGAINGALSEWAIENSIIHGPIRSITSRSTFDTVALKITKLPIYLERNLRGHHMYGSALAKYSEYLSEGYDSDIESDIELIILDSGISETEKTSLIKSRVGQGVFRQKLIAYWGSCSVTQFQESHFLIASHIKPWRASSNVERLDLFNGLLLVPNLDRAFDCGFISFDKNGNILISPQLKDASKIGIHERLKVCLKEEHEKYMMFHRNHVYRAT